MTHCPQTLRAPRPTLAGTTPMSMDELVRTTMEACEHAHDACLQAVRQALRQKREAPPLNDWLAGASLCRTLAEVLAVEAPGVEPASESAAAASRRQRLSQWATGMAQLCASLCGELAVRQAEDPQDEAAEELRLACEGCVQACVRLLADAGPPGGSLAAPSAAAPMLRRLRPSSLPPQGPSLAAA